MGWKFFKPYNEDSVFVTSLPTSPSDGQQVVLVDSLTAPTYAWRLAYMAAKASNKWLYLGGSPAIQDSISGSSTSISGTAQGTGIVLPYAGNYLINFGGMLWRSTFEEWLHVYLWAGNGTVSTYSIKWFRNNNITYADASHETLSVEGSLPTVAAGSTVRLYLANSNGASTVNIQEGYLNIVPKDIGG